MKIINNSNQSYLDEPAMKLYGFICQCWMEVAVECNNSLFDNFSYDVKHVIKVRGLKANIFNLYIQGFEQKICTR